MESHPLQNFTDREKGAYLGAIASLATADHAATDDELQHIASLADAMDISANQKQMVLHAAKNTTDEDLQEYLSVLKNSELRFSLITELISFARADGHYDGREKSIIEEIATQLGVSDRQYSLLDQFVTKAGTSEGQARPGFLDSLGLGDKFKAEGMNISTLGKGLLAIAAPLLLGKLFGGRRSTGSGGGMAGGLLGGGLGSLLGMLNMGRGFGNTGGLLSKILKNRKASW